MTNPFEKIKQEHTQEEEKLPQEGHYALDSHGTPHFGISREEATTKAREANEGYK